MFAQRIPSAGLTLTYRVGPIALGTVRPTLRLMGAYRVSLVIGFKPALTIAKQQSVVECLEALSPESLDFSDTECTVRYVTLADDSVAATRDAETVVARALFGAGHTMQTAPITSKSVEGV